MTRWITAHGCWGPTEAAAMKRLVTPGMAVADLGAHCGYFTLLLSNLVGAGGSVLAVEPDAVNHALLEANVERAGVENVRALRAAAWSESGSTVLSLCEDNTGDHRAYVWDSGRSTVRVPSIALDELDPPLRALDFVKIDVQGTEHLAVQGMRKLLGRFNPRMIVEFWPAGIRELGDDPSQVIALYRGELRYAITVLDGEPPEPNASAEALVRFADQRSHCNLLLTPPRLPDDGSESG